MDERTRRIVGAALQLAEQDGFDAVRLRDVARLAGTALATVYRRFPTKEDILVAALEHQIDALEAQIATLAGSSADPVERLTAAFGWMTDALLARPALAKALLRAVASGVPADTARVARFHGRTTTAILQWLGGSPTAAPDVRLAGALQDIWFARLVGWSGGLVEAAQVKSSMAATIAWLVGQDARSTPR